MGLDLPRHAIGFCLPILALLFAAAPASAGIGLSDPIVTPVAQASPPALAIAPVDADGIPDLVVLGAIPAAYGWYHGLGDGSFGPPGGSGALYLSPADLVVADFDGNGVPDIAAINSACT